MPVIRTWRFLFGKTDYQVITMTGSMLKEFFETKIEASHLSPISLRFTGDEAHLENAYIQHEYKKNIIHLRIAALLSIILYGSFYLFDFYFSPAQLCTFAIIRFVVVCPFFCLFIGATCFSFFRQIAKYVLILAVLLTSGGYIVMGLMAPAEVHPVYFVGLLGCLIFNYCFIRLPFIPAVGTGVLVCIAYCIALAQWGALRDNEIIVYVVGILCTQPLFAVICYTSECASRKNFFLMNQLSCKHRKINCINLELKDALDKVKLLSGLLPVCASCKKIRDKEGNWRPMEAYISERSEASFSHGLCPECQTKLYPDLET